MTFIKLNNKLISLNGKLLNVPMVFDPYANSLINRMILTGETPTVQRQNAINTCITNLRANGLFETQFDNLVVTRGYGINSTKMNWISNNFNAVGVSNLTYTAGVGYNSDGTSSYLNTKYIPSVHGNLFKLNDACFIIKESGTIPVNNTIHGAVSIDIGIQHGTQLHAGSPSWSRMNSTSTTGGQYTNGYTAVTRSSSSVYTLLNNSTLSNFNCDSSGLPTIEMYILSVNYSNVYTCSSTEKNELYAMGKSISQSQFLIFQNIMNTYFNSI